MPSVFFSLLALACLKYYAYNEGSSMLVLSSWPVLLDFTISCLLFALPVWLSSVDGWTESKFLAAFNFHYWDLTLPMHVCTFSYKHWPWYSLGSPRWKKSGHVWKSLGCIMGNGIPRESRGKKPSGFGLGSSLGTPFTMIPLRFFHTLSRRVVLGWNQTNKTNKQTLCLFVCLIGSKAQPCCMAVAILIIE